MKLQHYILTAAVVLYHSIAYCQNTNTIWQNITDVTLPITLIHTTNIDVYVSPYVGILSTNRNIVDLGSYLSRHQINKDIHHILKNILYGTITYTNIGLVPVHNVVSYVYYTNKLATIDYVNRIQGTKASIVYGNQDIDTLGLSFIALTGQACYAQGFVDATISNITVLADGWYRVRLGGVFESGGVRNANIYTNNSVWITQPDEDEQLARDNYINVSSGTTFSVCYGNGGNPIGDPIYIRNGGLFIEKQ